MAALLHGKLDYDDFFASQGGSLFPDDHRSTSAPPSQLLARRANQPEETEDKYLAENMGDSRQPWQLWETDHGNIKWLLEESPLFLCLFG